MHHKHVCNILKNTFTDATGISSLWYMLVFTLGRGWIYGVIQSSITYYTSVESFPHVVLQMSGPGNVFLKISLLLCTIKYFISLNCIDFKNSVT